jgi:membrane associated rhomboid family serine protease
MIGFDPSNDQQPVTWWRGYPIHSAMLLVIVHVATMLATTIALASGATGAVSLLTFNSTAVLNGAIWQPLTYALVHPPSLWFAVEMYLMWAFGREVERFFGLRSFFQLYFSLYLLTPIVLTLVGLFFPNAYFGSGSLHFAIFIAFAALYPGAPMIFNITAFWAAVILVAINTLQALAAQDVASLVSLWASIGLTVGWVKWARGELTVPSLDLLKRKPKLRVMPDPERRETRRAPVVEDSTVDDIDPLLDKIARSGMSSLTPAERALLEKARAALLRKDPGSR